MKDSEITALASKAYGDAPDGFSPLTDDGDALRLAVKLCIRIEQTDNYAVTWGGTVCAKQFSERINDDRYAATRRAITRAAAEIGKTIP
jgi:hypothetical protein